MPKQPPKTPAQFRLPAATIADLEACQAALGLDSKTAVVQMAVKQLADREVRGNQAPKKTSRKSK